MPDPLRKKKRCIQKTPDGETEEICTAMEDSLPRGEELDAPLRLRGID